VLSECSGGLGGEWPLFAAGGAGAHDRLGRSAGGRADTVEAMLPLLVVVVLGAVLQRVTGLGFALVVSPVIALLLGPEEGVLVVNACAVLTSSLLTYRLRALVDWRRYAQLLPTALLGVIGGALLTVAASRPVLEVLVGSLALLGLLASVLVARLRRADGDGGLPAAGAAGFLSGLMSSAAGVGGPAMVVYGVVSGWEQRRFAATLQPFFVSIAGSAIVAKLVAGASFDGLLRLESLLLLPALAVGLLLGELLAARLPARIARIGLLAVASIGSVAIIAHGSAELLAQ
jgi:hypothetical protein